MSDDLEETQRSLGETRPTDLQEHYIYYRQNQYVVAPWTDEHRTGAGVVIRRGFKTRRDAEDICYLLNGVGHDPRMVGTVKALLARVR
jgi:hypothetical protein